MIKIGVTDASTSWLNLLIKAHALIRLYGMHCALKNETSEKKNLIKFILRK